MSKKTTTQTAAPTTTTQSGSTRNAQSSSATTGFGNTSSQTGGFSNENVFDWLQMPDTQDINNLRGFQEEIDPSIDYSFARRNTDLEKSFQNPLGAYTTSAIRDATLRSEKGDLEQDYGQARRQAYNDMQGRTAQRRALLANLTAPQLRQTAATGTNDQTSESGGFGTSSSEGTSEGSGESTGTNSGGTNTTTQSGGLLGDLLTAGISGVGASLAGPGAF